MFALNFMKIINISRYDPIIFQTKVTYDLWFLEDYYQPYWRLDFAMNLEDLGGTKGNNSDLNRDILHIEGSYLTKITFDPGCYWEDLIWYEFESHVTLNQKCPHKCSKRYSNIQIMWVRDSLTFPIQLLTRFVYFYLYSCGVIWEVN